MEKITLSADRLWLIRSVCTWADGRTETRYYETPSMWNKSPMMATLFQSYESGEGHLTMWRKRDAAPKGWADGRSEVLDVVSLYQEILHSPNAVRIEVKKDKDRG